MSFPEKAYAEGEVKEAEKLVEKCYRRRLRVKGSPEFKQKVKKAIELVKTAGYYNFLRTYIGEIAEIDGFTQLRVSEAAIWANKYAVANPVDAASLFIQKANHMKDYLEGKPYYGGSAERRSVKKRTEFLEALKRKSRKKEIKEECERLLKEWSESVYL
ncbi:MAG: hypothetical protein NZ932_06895 [Candidatus Bathyarchaeota archaeon]|nr:hypothetical protein [Candidatus Bathyarchaeota archaeon]MDW8040267.1 hypothetical protein [Nitrososphaerota archaeon]